VIELLLEANAGPIIATTRTPEKLADLTARGVAVRAANFDDPASLRTAFAGADRLLLISTDVPGEQRAQQHLNAIAAAEQAGVKHVLYTSLVNPGPATPVKLAPDHLTTETALLGSMMDWTILRNNVYAEMLLGSLPRAAQMGQLFSACGDGRTAYITREDCARAAAAALVSATGRQVLDVTGPDALSQADLAQLASELSGKPVTYVPLPVDAIVQGMVGAGLPETVAQVYASFDTATAEGFFEEVTTTVQDLTGKPAIRVADFLAQNWAAVTSSPA
jgi:NAD(P)H dehydrogenase (quinone)